MGYIRTVCKDTEEFENIASQKIKDWEYMMKTYPDRAFEYENVIWGAHRILDMLDVDITEDNDIF